MWGRRPTTTAGREPAVDPRPGAKRASTSAATRGKIKDLFSRSRGVAELLVKDELRGAPKTSLNVPISGHRRLGEVSVPLDVFKAIKNELGGTVNDVVLAVSAGALRALLQERGEEPDLAGLRAMVPVSMRQAGENLALGNRVSSLFVELPAAEPTRASAIGRPGRQPTRSSTAARRRAPLRWWTSRASRRRCCTRSPAGSRSRRASSTSRSPTSPARRPPSYAMGAPLRHIFPLVPIFANHAIGIAITSYDGEMVFGINADRDAVPDLDVLERGLVESIDELREVAGVA